MTIVDCSFQGECTFPMKEEATAMTVQEMAASDKLLLTPKEASTVLGCGPYALNILAKEGRLPFKYFFSGNRLKIVKASLLEFLGYQG